MTAKVCDKGARINYYFEKETFFRGGEGVTLWAVGLFGGKQSLALVFYLSKYRWRDARIERREAPISHARATCERGEKK